MKYSKKYIISFYLLFFISLKVFSFHALIHNDLDTEECDICEFVHCSNELSFLEEDVVSVQIPTQYFFLIRDFQGVPKSLILNPVEYTPFCRPPPTI